MRKSSHPDTAEMDKGEECADAVGDDAGHAAVTDTNGAASGSDGASSASDSQEPSSASSDSDHGDTDEEWQTRGPAPDTSIPACWEHDA